MPRESLKRSEQQGEILDIKTLSPQTKMKMVLEVFDLGKGTEEEKQARKNKFMELVGKYHEAIIKAKPESSISKITSSDINKKKLHNQIMEILQSMSLSLNIPPDRRKLFEYLASNRSGVERMIETYFLGYDPTSPKEYTILKQALRGEGLFTSPSGKEDD